MTSLLDRALLPVRQNSRTLGAALVCEEPARVAILVLTLRRDLQQLAQSHEPAAQDRLARLSQGLRQIDRAARAGDFAQARATLTQWNAAL